MRSPSIRHSAEESISRTNDLDHGPRYESAQDSPAQAVQCTAVAGMYQNDIRYDARPVIPPGMPKRLMGTRAAPPAKRNRTHHHEPSTSPNQIPMRDISPNNQGDTGAKRKYSEDYDDSEDKEDMSGQGMDDKEAERIVEELLGKYTTLFEGSGNGEWGKHCCRFQEGCSDNDGE